MAASWTTDRFPKFEKAIRQLVEEHRELEDEPLHLAITYLPAAGNESKSGFRVVRPGLSLPAGRDQQHIYLLEVIGAFEGSVSPDRDLFEVTFGPASGFPMGPGEQLHLILTNPVEWETAVRDGWPLAVEVVNAIRAGDYMVLHEDEIGRRLLTALQAEAHLREAARG